MKSVMEIFGLNRRNTTASAVGELMADIERSPREPLRARRDRINRQREARMYREAEGLPSRIVEAIPAAHLEAELADRLLVLPTRPEEQLEDRERFDADFEVVNH